jgi:molecular chaperone HtpG
MEKIKIPARLEEILNVDITLDGFGKTILSEFGPWLKQNNVKFFSEYTDHSLKHVEDVLETADKLIREDCLGIITAGDVATLIVATLLHDCAMHLSEDGFATLLRSDDMIEGFGDKSWKLLWEDFIAESRRFSGRKLMALFGDTEAIKPPPYDPDEIDAHKLTGKQLLLMGEFLRRHHHRLAHEIARFGVPGPEVNQLKLPDKEETKHIVDLAGVVARSHGLPIRDCFAYLKDYFSSIKSFKRVHPVFLMALLRTSDILQVHSERAPRQVEKVRAIRSPVSKGEWEMHQAIKDINWTEFPETIFIHAEPKNVKTYLKIKNLIEQIQSELDSSWAVMSEAYHQEPSLRELGFKIRRVRSNLDNEEAFAKKVGYIPSQASFEVADTDLLKLLIGPLYGERPEIGIRELMQNAVDAVQERREYMKKHPELKDVEFIEQEAEVVVSIDKEDDGWWVTVSDQGIGMTLDTVRNYFLKAGASLRHSEIWRKTFENEDGKSQVLRSGRFGVGVLAAFLLGDEVEISTRHVNETENNGIAFSAKLDAETIELLRVKCPVGTTVRVRISAKVKDELMGGWNYEEKWDWYCLRDPKILRIIDHGNKKLRQKYQLPTLNSNLPLGWYRISHPDYQDIHWTYENAPDLICNGIKIKKETIRDSSDYQYFRVGIPNISVFDYDANLPLNITRTNLTQDKFPFHNELLNDIFKDFIAFAFVNTPSLPLSNKALFKWCSFCNYPGVSSIAHPGIDEFLEEIINLNVSTWFFTKSGISFSRDPWHISLSNASYTLVVPFYDLHENDFIPDIVLSPSNAVFSYEMKEQKLRTYIDLDDEVENQRLEIIIDFALKERDNYISFTPFFIPGTRILISHHVLKKIYLPKPLRSQIVEEWKNENWVLWRYGDCPSPGFDFEKFAVENDGKNYDQWPCVLAEWYFKDPKPQLKESELSPLAKVWKEVVDSPIIPFDLEERRKMKVYKELKSYIEAHEKMKKMKAHK